MNDVLLLAATLVAGLLIGTLVTLAVTRRAGGGRGAGDLRRDLDAYRDDVANHYAETARKVDALTRAYKDVYDHLETGAYRLVGEEALRARLADTKATTVTLEGIGPRRLESTTTATTPAAAATDAAASETPGTAVSTTGTPTPDGQTEGALPDWSARDVAADNVPDAWTPTDANDGTEDEAGTTGQRPENAHDVRIGETDDSATDPTATTVGAAATKNGEPDAHPTHASDAAAGETDSDDRKPAAAQAGAGDGHGHDDERKDDDRAGEPAARTP